MVWPRGVGNRAFSRFAERYGIQAKLALGAPGDRFEREADRVADRIVSGGDTAISAGPPAVQRLCAQCEEEQEETERGVAPAVQRQRADGRGEVRRQPAGHPPGLSLAAGRRIAALSGGGQPLPSSARGFFERRFGRDFGDVRIHRDARAGELAESIGARAFTYGRDVAFAPGELAPDSARGRRLLAHELTHVVQQGGGGGSAGVTAAPARIQREVYRGHDHGGSYALDDGDCTLTYRQRWYFNFQTSQTAEERLAYMEAARQQIQDVWSVKYPLIPEDEECACHPAGIRVLVRVTAIEGERSGRGFSITVTPTESRGFTNPAIRTIDLGTRHETPVNTPAGLTQQRIAHEFGHTIDLTDEYNGWADLFYSSAARDQPSIMHSGDEVRPRHYQHFADLASFELAPCTYWPDGVRQPEVANPVERFTGIPFTFQPDRADFVFGLQYDRRVSNDALLGLFYPTVGAMTLWDPDQRSVALGPTAGLRLSQIAHPLFVDVRTGVLFDPEDPEADVGIDIPLALEVGMRTEGLEVGVNYTPIVNVLGAGRWTHLVGVGGRFDFPWERRR